MLNVKRHWFFVFFFLSCQGLASVMLTLTLNLYCPQSDIIILITCLSILKREENAVNAYADIHPGTAHSAPGLSNP